MVTTTTKTLNYSITKGNQTNSVNATITSTPGFNSNYLGKVPGILKLVELLLAAIAVGLVASLRSEQRLLVQTVDHGSVYPTGKNYLQELFLVSEVYFLCAHSAVLTVLVIILGAYLFHTTSAMIIPKATTLENVANIILALLLLAAGITLIVLTEIWKYDPDYPNEYRVLQAPPRQSFNQEPVRLAAGAIALLNGLLFIGSFVLSRKELAGPKTL
jgi:cytochrome bd-type quinol oxidase subunit 2